MPKFRFPSTTNANLFRDVLDAGGVEHDGYDDVVKTNEALPGFLDGQLEMLGGWDEAADNSTTGVNGFLDISAFSTRSNPPAEIRGDPPIEPRGIGMTFRGGPDGSRSRLETQMGNGFPARRSTRGQPL